MWRVTFILALLAALGMPGGWAHAQAASVPAAAEPLHLFNRPVFTFRATLLGVSAADRAKRAHTRIQDQLTLTGPHVVTVKAEGSSAQVQIDGATSFVVLPADLAPGQDDTLAQAAQRAADALPLAIQESRDLEALALAPGIAKAGLLCHSLGAGVVRALVEACVMGPVGHHAKLPEEGLPGVLYRISAPDGRCLVLWPRLGAPGSIKVRDTEQLVRGMS